MKDKLLQLIEQKDAMQVSFEPSKLALTGIFGRQPMLITMTPEFLFWKQSLLFELEEIRNAKRGDFIKEIIASIHNSFNGKGNDEKIPYDELCAKLNVLRDRIDQFYHVARIDEGKVGKANPMVFISHSSKDRDFVKRFVELLEDIKLSNREVFCSAVPEYGIPGGENIYDYLRTQFQTRDLFVLFFLSKNYYNSPAALNEMGAAWLLQSQSWAFLLPGFHFSEMKGAIGQLKLSVEFEDEQNLKHRLGELKDSLLKWFDLPSIDPTTWERKRDSFIKDIDDIHGVTKTAKPKTTNQLEDVSA